MNLRLFKAFCIDYICALRHRRWRKIPVVISRVYCIIDCRI